MHKHANKIATLHFGCLCWLLSKKKMHPIFLWFCSNEREIYFRKKKESYIIHYKINISV